MDLSLHSLPGIRDPLFVASLIPVLTDYPLAFAFMGDMLAGGFFLALAGFFAALAAVDTGNPYGPMGASRTRMVGFLAEPVFMIVFFTVSFVAQSTIPYIVQKTMGRQPCRFFLARPRPSADRVFHADSCRGGKDSRG